MATRVGVIVLALLMGLAAIDGRSLWTDELGTWTLTQPATWPKWASYFWHLPNSDGQVPMYYAYMRAWVPLLGDSEWVMRASNLPWLAFGLFGLSRVRIPAMPSRWFLVAAALSAFVWYYLNDARSYIFYMSGACWLAAGMVRLCADELNADETDAGLRDCLLGSVVLIGGSILGALWIASCLLALGLLYASAFRATLQSAARQWGWVALAVLIAGCVVAVAIHSHLSGARANQTAAFSVAGMVYGLIEILGAAGLGPSRNDLRSNVTGADKAELGMMFCLFALTGFAVLHSWWKVPSWRQRGTIAVAAGLPLIAIAALGLLLHWRVVGRHLSAILPVVLIGIGIFLHTAFAPRQAVWIRVLGGLLVVGMAASSISMRLAPRHMKDDYKQAAQWATDDIGKGRSVLWIADERGLSYYGLTSDRPSADIKPLPNVIPFSQFPAFSSQVPYPDTVILSPREGVDPNRIARPVLDSGRYSRVATASSFELYRRNEQP